MRDLVIGVVFFLLVGIAFTSMFKELATVKTNVHKILSNK